MSDIISDQNAEESSIPMWLTNIGLKTRFYEITYQELANLVSEVAVAANELQDPRTFVDPKSV